MGQCAEVPLAEKVIALEDQDATNMAVGEMFKDS